MAEFIMTLAIVMSVTYSRDCDHTHLTASLHLL
jgi:hypothetical protein